MSPDPTLLKYLSVMNLDFGVFDLIKSVDGYWYFLECNPDGQWLFLDASTAVSTTRAMQEHLSGLCAP